MKFIVAIHDVSSGHRLTEITKVILAYRKYVKMVVISRATGAAAQYGLAEASKTFYKAGIKLLILPDIEDYNELFKGNKILQFTRIHGREYGSIRDLAITEDTVLLISGNDNGFSKNELLENTEKIYPRGTEKQLPPETLLGVILHDYINHICEDSN